MKISFLFLILLSASTSLIAQQALNPAIEKNVDDLLKQMTLEEKVGQMAQVSIESLGSTKGENFSFGDKMPEAVSKYLVGSVLNTPGAVQSPQSWNRIQSELNAAVQKTRLKIPVLYGLDQVHGASYVKGATLFPQEIGQAASWNRQLIHDAGVITAYESRAAGVPWTFSPVLDLGTNPLWPRIWEGYGEDPYLTSQMGEQFVKGVQDPFGS